MVAIVTFRATDSVTAVQFWATNFKKCTWLLKLHEGLPTLIKCMVAKVTRRVTDTNQVYGCNLRVIVYRYVT
jgi:hypothetical protein